MKLNELPRTGQLTQGANLCELSQLQYFSSTILFWRCLRALQVATPLP